MPKMIPIFFTTTPLSGNTNPAFARLPLLSEMPKDARRERFHHPFFILSEKCGICKLKGRWARLQPCKLVTCTSSPSLAIAVSRRWPAHMLNS